ncbi:MAG TPA: DNA polymerase III subunit delta' [Xanthomonadales bacterium]|nr:DNA polymerase III subunit delta' [Xanthomonadales bacterium]
MSPPALPPWLVRTLQPTLAALTDQRLGHALLLSGPARLGKRAAAEALAARLLCREPDAQGWACGRCRACDLRTANSHPDLLRIELETSPNTGKLRSDIVVDQIRRLGEWFALTSQMGGVQVALIDPADAMNASAGNALLKTLEEPQPGRYLLLTSARPDRLPATIRSRCQRLSFSLPPHAEALAHLLAAGQSRERSERALSLAGGHPGLALDWLADGSLELRESVHRDLAALSERRVGAVEVATAWQADERLALRLRFAAESVLDPARSGLTDGSAANTLWQWFVEANRLRASLDGPIRVDLALTGLLHRWRITQTTAEDRPRSRR